MPRGLGSQRALMPLAPHGRSPLRLRHRREASAPDYRPPQLLPVTLFILECFFSWPRILFGFYLRPEACMLSRAIGGPTLCGGVGLALSAGQTLFLLFRMLLPSMPGGSTGGRGGPPLVPLFRERACVESFLRAAVCRSAMPGAEPVGDPLVPTTAPPGTCGGGIDAPSQRSNVFGSQLNAGSDGGPAHQVYNVEIWTARCLPPARDSARSVALAPPPRSHTPRVFDVRLHFFGVQAPPSPTPPTASSTIPPFALVRS